MFALSNQSQNQHHISLKCSELTTPSKILIVKSNHIPVFFCCNDIRVQ